MVKADLSTFKLALEFLEVLSNYLSNKYTECKDNSTEHYQTIIIQKIVRMFKTLESLTLEVKDETSARCVLRGILDNVAIYCFIYSIKKDIDEKMFRHYLYNLDGFQSLKIVSNCYLEEGIDKAKTLYEFDEIIEQIKEKLNAHPYVQSKNEKIEKIINDAKWNYKSLQEPKSLSYKDIYINIGLDEKNATYYQQYLSQFSHGLCLSNKSNFVDDKKVLLESVPLAFIMIKTIMQVFPEEKLLNVITENIDMNTFNFDIQQLLDIIKAIMNGEKVFV